MPRRSVELNLNHSLTLISPWHETGIAILKTTRTSVPCAGMRHMEAIHEHCSKHGAIFVLE